MRLYSDAEVVVEAKAFLDMNLGVVKTAKVLKIPKSTLHYHLSQRLRKIDYTLWLYTKSTLVRRRTK